MFSLYFMLILRKEERREEERGRERERRKKCEIERKKRALSTKLEPGREKKKKSLQVHRN